jgi:ABC-type multidrug transport system fused ATPase/permease subunit
LKTEGIANGCAEDALSLAETVAAFGATNIEHQRYANALYKNSLTCIAVRTSYSLLKIMQVSILGVGSALIAYAGWRSAIRDSGSNLFNNIPGKLVLIQGLYAQLCAPLDHVGQHFRDCVTASEDLRELLSLSSSLPKPSIASESKTTSSLPIISRQYLSKSQYVNASPILEIKNVTFAYSSNDRNSSTYILKDISLTVPSGGMSVGIVGPSGSGKSTLLRVILGLEPIHSDGSSDNKIIINGVDVTEMERMSCFAMVGQENDLFRSLTLAQNIMYGTSNTTNDSKLHEILVEKALGNAVEDASLWPLIMKIEGGWNAQVGPRGRLLSGGERQRVCLARALFREEIQGGILLMDEITASLDAKTESMVTEAIQARVQKGATAILIAHRLASIQHCNMIIVMKDGQIIERGNHHNLMDKKGWYYDSWMLQQSVSK